MAVPTYLNEGGGDKVLGLVDAAEAYKFLAAIEISSAPAGYGWMGVATHVEADAVAAPGGFTTSAAPLVLMGGDKSGNAAPLQLDASEYLKVILQAGTAAVGKLAPNSGVDIGDVDVTSLPTGQNTMANSTPVVLASDHSDIKITLDSEAVVLGAGSAAIGKLAPNSGVDIGDVDVTSVPAPLNVVGGGAEAAALRVTIANDSTGLVSIDDGGGDISIDDGGNSITVDGNVGDDGPGWTPVRKYLAKSTTADATLWNPSDNYLYITDIIISISGTATDVTLGFGAGTALTDVFFKFHGDVRGGVTHQFRTPAKSTSSGDNLNIALSAAQAMTILVLGYEKAT